MKDFITNILNHERYQAIAVLLCAGLLIWFFGCESTVRSLQDPTVKVNRSQLEAETNAYLSQVELKLSELDKQDEIRRIIVEKSLLFAQTGAINPSGIIATIVSILGVGALVDNARKRKELKNINN